MTASVKMVMSSHDYNIAGLILPHLDRARNAPLVTKIRVITSICHKWCTGGAALES